MEGGNAVLGAAKARHKPRESFGAKQIKMQVPEQT